MNKIIHNPASYDFTNGFLTKLIAHADRGAANAGDNAFCYEFGGKNVRHALESIRKAGAYIATAEADIAAGRAPDIARDSSLYTGSIAESLLLTYDWCAEHMPAELGDRILNLLKQTADNIINPNRVTWGGKAYPSTSGWPHGDPESNYQFSFIQLFAMLGLIVPERMAYVTDTLWPRMEAFYLPREGGGSGEGTGYGEALARYYRVARLLKDSGIAIPGAEKHANQHIEYMIHASKPGLKKLANIGDQPREHDNKIDDPDEVVVLEAMAISTDEKAKALGRWWLDNNGEVFDRADLYRFACLDRRGERTAPTELVYHAKSVGHLFARTSWTDPNASWIAVTCGKQNQVHDSRDQGGITFHSGGVTLVETQNARTRTGINQGAEYQNVMLFRDEKGVKVEQNRTGICPLSSRISNGYLIVDADASPAFARIKWTREAYFSNGGVNIADHYEMPAGYTATHQINTPYLPVIDGDTIAAGPLKIVILSSYTAIRIVDWKVVNQTENPNGGYKIEIDSKSGYLNTEWLDTASEQYPFPTEEDPVRIEQLEAQVASLENTMKVLNDEIEFQDNKILKLTSDAGISNAIIEEQSKVIDEQSESIAKQAAALEAQAPKIELLGRLAGAMKEAVSQ
jgi:hypothetical protein